MSIDAVGDYPALPSETVMAPLEVAVPELDDEAPVTASSASATPPLAPQEPAAEPTPLPPNYTLQAPYGHAPTPRDEQREVLPLPSNSVADARQVLANVPKVNYAAGAKGAHWAQVLELGSRLNLVGDGLLQAADRGDAQWVQALQHEGKYLAGSIPNFKSKPGDSGEKAVIRMRQALGLGAVFNLPLWQSGFWLRIKAPSDADLLELYRSVMAEKISLGRSTAGLVFANTQAYMVRPVTDLIARQLYECSLALPEGEDVMRYIKVTDLHPLILGLAQAIWPNGFLYERACIAEPEKCDHVVRERIDLAKLHFVDQSRLTQRQIAHMAKMGSGKMTLESVLAYQNEFIQGQERIVSIREGEGSPEAKITLRVPSIAEYVEAGHRWISHLENTYGAALAAEPDKRDDFISEQGKASAMRQYAHFVTSIEIADLLVEERETLEDMLSQLSSSAALMNHFIEQVLRYIDDSVMSLVGLPTYKCPSCGGEQHTPRAGSRYPRLIPLDTLTAFFTLLATRQQRIALR